MNKQVRVGVDGDQIMTNPPTQPVRITPSVSRRRPILTPQNIIPNNNNKKSIVQALGKRVEQYDLINNLSQASAGITFVR